MSTLSPRTLRRTGALAIGTLVAGAFVALAPAASAADQTVVATSAKWGVKESLRKYVANGGVSSPRNSITVSDCATFDGVVSSTRTPVINMAPFTWPNGAGAETFDPATNAGTARLGGKVSLAYVGHFEAMSFANPTVQLAGDGTGKVFLDVGIESNALNQHTNTAQVHFANLASVPVPTTSANGDGTTTTTFSAIPATITAAGNLAINEFYSAGAAIDPVTVSFTHGTPSASPTATTTALTASPNETSQSPTPVTLTATVTPSGAAGCVRFFDGATSLGTQTISAGVASKQVTGLAVGPHTLSAVFTPAAPYAYATSTSTVLVHQVTPPPARTATTTTLTLSPAAVAYGKARTARVTVAGVTAPTGTVTLKEGSRSFGTKALVGTRAAFALPATLGVGRHALTATYSGSTTLLPSSKAATLNVVKASTKSTGKLTKKSVKVGKKGKITAKVTATGFVPSGKVAIKEGKKTLKTVTLKRGKATITLPKLKKGKHKLVVRYLGNGSAKASTSSKVTLTVKK